MGWKDQAREALNAIMSAEAKVGRSVDFMTELERDEARAAAESVLAALGDDDFRMRDYLALRKRRRIEPKVVVDDASKVNTALAGEFVRENVEAFAEWVYKTQGEVPDGCHVVQVMKVG